MNKFLHQKKGEAFASPSSSMVLYAGWSQNVQEIMKKYLGRNLLPYTKLDSMNSVDTSNAVTNIDFVVLTIESDESWTTTTPTEDKIPVRFEKKDKSDNTIVIKTTYDEDNNKNGVTAVMNAEVLSVFSSALGTKSVPLSI